ncbi:hypothetical protein B6A10_03495 [Flavobacterium sp. L1I52]|uniref:FAS1 domain-containing protein n=1 Tax=Flavobacterium pokkalii TaxID=1940408 RepID=A0ABR7UP75_9FLAO|nr:fasciclin domain-containing protein [Flavobacterium pokkalii]KQB38125.1 Secreted/surface protein with fasciclin-like repeat containing protein [Flavobacterium daejeonense]MBD0724236.1 hypothetical protein [Flavobacterium pokkalii]
MKRKFNYLLILPLLALFASCSRDAFNEFYGRPDYLEDPIYQQLEARGNFKNLTTLIEKAGYKDILGKAGYWTMFAPNDAAFEQYFQDNGISDVSEVDDATASKIVKYALVYNKFREDQLSDYQSSRGWVENTGFRRRTAFYDGFVSKTINGLPKVIVGSNRNGVTYYIPGDNNNKYVTYFAEDYFTERGLTANDFNFFYPGAEYTGLNLFDGKVTEADIVAENGVIHEVDKVNLPKLNLDQYLEGNSNYSTFRSIMEDYLVKYVFDQSATTAYRNYTGKSDDVFVKVYDPTLAFAPNNENYLKAEDNDGQSEAYTMIVPENNALQEFIDTVLLKHFDNVAQLPIYVFQDFINAHMVQGVAWPSKFGDYNNYLKEDLRFNINTDITDKKVLSNGFFYGSSKVQHSDLFYSVYTSAYLDPKYSFATRIFNDGSGYRDMISNIHQKFTIFLPSDNVLRGLGFEYNSLRQEWVYVNPSNGTADGATAARNRLVRLLYNCIVYTPNGELDNIANSSGVIRTGDYDLPGEYIRYDNNRIQAAGNIEKGTYATIVGSDVQENGTAYYIDNVPQFSIDYPGLQGKVIERLATSNTEFNSFFQYLRNSSVYNSSTGKIEGIELGTSCTFVVPNNAAIARAVLDGELPASNNPGTAGERDVVADFIRYHIIVNATASNDGLVTGLRETLRKDEFGEKTYVNIASSGGSLSFKDGTPEATSGGNPAANFILASSNNLADRSLIHLVDNYLKFPKPQQ